MVCTTARDAVLRDSDSLWYGVVEASERLFFRRGFGGLLGPAVVGTIPMRPYPNFMKITGGLSATNYPPITWQMGRGQWPDIPSESKKEFSEIEVKALATHGLRCARIRFSTRCGMCGAQHKLLQVWGVGMRVCTACMKDNLVSGAALLHDYGLNYVEHIDKLTGKVFYFSIDVSTKHVIPNLTHNPVDFAPENARSGVFFWRPHLERVLNLAEFRAKVKCQARIAAGQKISSAVRALRVRLFLAQTARCSSKICHSFHIGAQAQPKGKHRTHTLRPLSDAERMKLLNWLPACPWRKPVTEEEAWARSLLQKSFLSWRGPYSLLAVRNPASTLEKLRALEANRGPRIVRAQVARVDHYNYRFTRWFGLAPVL